MAKQPKDRYGLAPRRGSSPSYTDARLRGLSMRTSSGARSSSESGYDFSARAYQVTHEDPYEEQARREQELGRRMPAPYQAASALAGTLPFGQSPAYYKSQYEDLHSDASVWPAASEAGRRMTQSGTFGSNEFEPDMWDARARAGFGRSGSRGPGFDEEWDARGGRERRSGRVTAVGLFSQKVDPRWPFLYLAAKGDVTSGGNAYSGNAFLRVEAGLSETGGAEQVRDFYLGGGMTAQFDLHGWDTATIRVTRILAGTWVEFAWVTNGIRTDTTLFYPQTFVPAAGAVQVPQGAYALYIEDPTPAVPATITNVTWITQGAGVGGADLSFLVEVGDTNTNNQYGQPLPTLGTAVQISAAVDAVWALRGI
jgi:hypothetical protein